MALIGAHKIRNLRDTKNYSQQPFEWINVTRGKGKIGQYQWLYEGQVFERKAHGFGVLSKAWKSGEIEKIYAGDWFAGKKQGVGNFWYNNGDFYQGDFCQGKRHGFGRLWGFDGSYYQGNWKDDHCHGFGMLIQVDGNRYEGNFLNGKKEGFGKFYHLKSGQVQEGFWVANTCKQSSMRDISRELAPEPTIYPIPEMDKYISSISLGITN